MERTPLLVSIVVNNYNYGRFLREAIDSALNQTYPHTEVVVVDDGSIDDSRDIIASYGGRVIPVLKENGGQGSAVNAGFAASRGEVVIFLDADDYLFPGAVERVLEAWGPGVVHVQYRLEKVDASGTPTGFDPPLGLPLGSGELRRALLRKGSYVRPPTSGLGFRRAALDQVFPMPEAEYRRAADEYLAASVPFYGPTNAIDEALGAYRVHGSNSFVREGVPGSEWFSRLVRDGLKRQALIIRKANELGYSVPPDPISNDYGIMLSRVLSLRLDPQKHPIPSDRRLSLVYPGLRAIWRYSSFDWRWRLVHSAWFVWISLLPLPLAKLAVVWMHAPQSRPKVVEWIRKKIRSS